MKIYEVTDPLFSEYGRLVRGYDTGAVCEAMKKTPCPEEGTVYKPSESELEKLPIYNELQENFYGFMPMQIGYCNGHNTKLNALEYHRSSEINISADGDIVLLLAKRSDLDADFQMSTEKVRAFRVPMNTPVEIFASTLHYAPCTVNPGEGFRVVIILPRGTNLELPRHPKVRDGEEKLMTATNKWLIAHPEGGCGAECFAGLLGENIDLSR